MTEYKILFCQACQARTEHKRIYKATHSQLGGCLAFILMAVSAIIGLFFWPLWLFTGMCLIWFCIAAFSLKKVWKCKDCGAMIELG